MTVINSTPEVSSATTQIICQDATDEAEPSSLNLARLFNTGTTDVLPAPAVISDTQLVGEWDSSLGNTRFGVYQCTSDAVSGQSVVTLKMSRDGKSVS